MIGTISNNESGSSCRAKINQTLSLWDGMAGVIMAFGGSTAPSKWALCNGAAISRTTYSDLFAVIGTSYGVGNNSTTFNLPDLRGRTPVGVGGLAFADLGALVGVEQITLLEENLPSHSHYVNVPNSTFFVSSGEDFNALGNSVGLPTQTTSIGTSEPFEIIQPSLVVNYIIYTGV